MGHEVLKRFAKFIDDETGAFQFEQFEETTKENDTALGFIDEISEEETGLPEPEPQEESEKAQDETNVEEKQKELETYQRKVSVFGEKIRSLGSKARKAEQDGNEEKAKDLRDEIPEVRKQKRYLEDRVEEVEAELKKLKGKQDLEENIARKLKPLIRELMYKGR